ncbi:hypothetical protein VTN00DRAFT_1633 [Thermoascus crustaceus]|uniref:uncharacterized protein n=1 Tax=Thermoascus crustaceus TaxID=5088 RepID=UPI003743006B
MHHELLNCGKLVKHDQATVGPDGKLKERTGGEKAGQGQKENMGAMPRRETDDHYETARRIFAVSGTVIGWPGTRSSSAFFHLDAEQANDDHLARPPTTATEFC